MLSSSFWTNHEIFCRSTGILGCVVVQQHVDSNADVTVGCVEVPWDAAKKVWPMLTYGSLVTVAGPVS